MFLRTLAENINNSEYGKELTERQLEIIKNKGLNIVIVYGRSDDRIEFNGAISDEASFGETVLFKNEIMELKSHLKQLQSKLIILKVLV